MTYQVEMLTIFSFIISRKRAHLWDFFDELVLRKVWFATVVTRYYGQSKITES